MTQSQSWTPEAKVLTCCLGGSPCVQKLGCISKPGACPALPHPHRVIGTHSLRETENQARLTRVAIQTRIDHRQCLWSDAENLSRVPFAHCFCFQLFPVSVGACVQANILLLLHQRGHWKGELGFGNVS